MKKARARRVVRRFVISKGRIKDDFEKELFVMRWNIRHARDKQKRRQMRFAIHMQARISVEMKRAMSAHLEKAFLYGFGDRQPLGFLP